MAAPAESRTPNMYRAKQIAPRACGWKHGDSGRSAGEKTGIEADPLAAVCAFNVCMTASPVIRARVMVNAVIVIPIGLKIR
jgi:hypothetical protein